MLCMAKTCHHTLPKWNILSGPAHPPKVNYSFRTSTSSQSEIFFQDQHTLPKWNILSGPAHPSKVKYYFQEQRSLPKWNILFQSCYCCLLRLLAFQDQHTLPKWNILSNLQQQHWERIFHFGKVYWSWKADTCNNNSFETEYFQPHILFHVGAFLMSLESWKVNFGEKYTFLSLVMIDRLFSKMFDLFIHLV